MIAKSDAAYTADDTVVFSSARHAGEMSEEATALETQASSKIMIVDDEPIIIRVAQQALRAAGFTDVHSSCDPATAFRSILDYQPDALILDVMMPEVSGLDILRQLRQADSTRQLPVIVLTASDDRETKLQALNLGATDFLSKPVDSLELTPRVRNAIRSKHFHDHLKIIVRNWNWLCKERRLSLSCLAEKFCSVWRGPQNFVTTTRDSTFCVLADMPQLSRRVWA